MAASSATIARCVRRSVAAASLGLCAAFPAEAITVDAFAASPAGVAYREGRFDAALGAIDALLAREPGDPILLRVRGMTLYRLERFAESETTLRAAVAAAPNDPAARYWLGAALHKRGDADGARQAFAAVERMAPGSRYADSAREYGTALASPAVPGTSDSGRPWSLSIATGVQHDDNVALLNTDRIRGWRMFAETEGRYSITLPRDFTLSFEGRAFGSGHFRSPADDFNIVALTGGPTLSWRTILAGHPLRLSVGYGYEHIREGARFYSDAHAVTARAEAVLLPDSLTGAAFTFAVDRFALATGADPAIFSRDGFRYVAAIRHVHYLPGRRHYVWASYEFTQFETDGRNFDAYAHVGAVGVSVGLPWDIRVDAGAELGITRYPNYVDAPRRRSLKQTYTVLLTKAITRNLTVSAAYAHTFDDSNIRDFETRRNLFTMSARYAF